MENTCNAILNKPKPKPKAEPPPNEEEKKKQANQNDEKKDDNMEGGGHEKATKPEEQNETKKADVDMEIDWFLCKGERVLKIILARPLGNFHHLHPKRCFAENFE